MNIIELSTLVHVFWHVRVNACGELPPLATTRGHDNTLLSVNKKVELSLTILVYLHSFSCCCVRNLRNPEKFSEKFKLIEFKVIQGHRSCCQSKAHMQLPVGRKY